MNPRLIRLLESLPRPRLRAAKVLTAAGVVLGVIVLALVVSVPKLLDGTRQGQAIANQIATATNLRVVIDGPVEVSIWPRPHIGINQFRLISLDGATTRLAVPRVDLNVTLGSLLSGDYEVEQIALQQPQFTVDPSGTFAGRDLTLQLQALSVRRISIHDGALTINGGPVPENISAINGSVLLPDSTTLLRTNLKADWRGAPLHLMIDIATPLGSDPSLARASLDIGAAEAALTLAGIVDFAKPDWPVQAQLDVQAAQGATLWALAASLGFAPSAPADAALRQPLTMSAVLNGNRSTYNFEGIKLALGDWPVEGLARIVTGKDGGLSVALKTGVVDLANWPTLLDWSRRGSLVIPAQWLGAFDLNLGGLVFANYNATNMRLKGEIKNGTLSFSEASAQLPGGARANLSGTITTAANAAAVVDGKATLEALQLRDLLTAWQVPLPAGVEDSAFRQLKASADLRGSWSQLGLSNLELQLDGVKLTGQVSPSAPGARLAASLTIEQLNLDQYAAAGGLPGWLWQLPGVDFNLRLGRVQAGSQQAENINLQGQLENGLLTVKSLEAADFGGNKLRLSGTLSADAARDADFTLRLVSPDFAALTQSFAPAARLVPPQLVSLLGANTDLSVRWRRSTGETQQLSSATFAEGRFDVVLTEKADTPTRWKVRLQNRETALWLARLLPAALSRPDAVLGLMDVYAEGEALTGNSWRVANIQGQLAGISFKGGELTVTPGAPTQVSGQLSIGQGSLALLQQTLNLPTLLPLLNGEISLSADKLIWRGQPVEQVNATLTLSPGGQLALANTTGRWRDGQFTLSGQATLAGVPTLKGQLDLRETNLSWLGGDRFGMDGVTDFSLRAESSGSDWAQLMRNLSGDGEFSLDSGTLKGIDFAALTEALLDKRPPATLDAILARGGESVLSTFGGDFAIEEGVLRAPALRLRTPAASAEIAADIDLSVPRLDAAATVTLRDVASAKPFMLRLSGRLDNVSASFDAQALTASAKPASPTPATGPVTNAMGQAKSEDPAQDVVEVKPPEMPSPPSLDEPVAEPVAAAAAPATKPATERASRSQQRSTTNTANREPAPRRERSVPQTSTAAATPPGSPPSIQELLQAMPVLNEAATAAVREAAPLIAQPPAAGPRAAMPEINFTPVDDAPAPRAAPTRQPVAANGLAPEFEGMKPQTTRDTSPPAEAPLMQTQMDIVGSSDDGPPAASVDELMGRVRE